MPSPASSEDKKDKKDNYYLTILVDSMSIN